MPLLCSTLCPDAHTAAVVAGERVHASAIAPDLDVRAPLLSSRTPSNLPGAVSGFASPFSFLAFASRRDELEPPPSSAPTTPRHPASIPRTQSRATSPRTHSAPPRARPCPTPAEIRPQTAVAIAVRYGAPPSPSSSHLQPFSAQIRCTVSSPTTPSSSPTFSPGESAAAVAAPPPPRARRGAALRAPALHHRAPRSRQAPRTATPPPSPASAAGRAGTAARRRCPAPALPRAALRAGPAAPPWAQPRWAAWAAGGPGRAAGVPRPGDAAAAAGLPGRHAVHGPGAWRAEEGRWELGSHLHVGPGC